MLALLVTELEKAELEVREGVSQLVSLGASKLGTVRIVWDGKGLAFGEGE